VTAGDTALVVAAVVGLLAIVLLSVALVVVARALRGLQGTVELLRQDAAARAWSPVPRDAAGAGLAGDGSVAPARRDAGSLLARVAVANPYLDVSDPVIKVLALASGTTRAASRLRRARQGG
jgi:hypothetical protein